RQAVLVVLSARHDIALDTPMGVEAQETQSAILVTASWLTQDETAAWPETVLASVASASPGESERTEAMPVSVTNSQLIYDALKACDIRLLSALPETWLVHLIRMAEEDPEVTLVRLAKEEEGVGISAGAHLAGVRSAMLMQNHGFLASINGIVSLAHLYK